MLKIIPQGAVFAAPHACLELHLVLYVHPESVLPSDTEFFLMGSKDYNSTSLTHFLVNRFGDNFKILLSTGLALKFGVVELHKWSWVLTAAP